jgi:hypothetical protein
MFSIVLLGSCSKDENLTNYENLVGSWKYLNILEDSCARFDSLLIWNSTDTLPIYGMDTSYSYVYDSMFNSNPVGIGSSDDYFSMHPYTRFDTILRTFYADYSSEYYSSFFYTDTANCSFGFIGGAQTYSWDYIDCGDGCLELSISNIDSSGNNSIVGQLFYSYKINQNNTMEFCITRLVNNSPQLLFPVDTTYQQPHECYTFTKQ